MKQQLSDNRRQNNNNKKNLTVSALSLSSSLSRNISDLAQRAGVEVKHSRQKSELRALDSRKVCREGSGEVHMGVFWSLFTVDSS